ncbi:FliI/YscN family ATPase [Frigidibacter sp. ROC022]|uniref:FliI/YscN family ATPase n=1 Tax=Frigidibacter sp. ROC022 TaxID=2971796 RepID=UPI00215AA114|nr:FliI/YscN family ATPase [Frigidibacter sp. ROC022]MCR8724372.1 FliI/YscN family ATPase [Frigidibacter sp. ROC022]
MNGLDHLKAEIDAIPRISRIGRIVRLDRGLVSVNGLSDIASPGDLVELGPRGSALLGEVLGVDAAEIAVMTDVGGDGLTLGQPVVHRGGGEVAPDSSWIGRVIDPFGEPLDGRPLLRGLEPLPVRRPPPNAHDRRAMGQRLETGLAVFNSFLPIARGQRIGLFAGAGVGKSTLLGRLTRGIEADVVVISLIGERGRELREFIDRILGPAGMERTVVVAATSDQPALVRRRCGWTAAAVAEYFRDQGRQVLLLADSLTRFAEAHREIALAAGETASLRGYPPSTAAMIAGLCERAGPGERFHGDITAIFTVLVAGSDMDEPVADMVRGVLDGHVVLDRRIAERGRFPAVDLLRSVSRALPDAASEEENALLARARALLGHYEKAELMVQAGLYTAGSDPELDIAIRLWPLLDAFLAESEPGSAPDSFARLAEILRLAGAIT